MVTDWAEFETLDKPGSNLHREFLLAQELTRRGIPLVISIWYLPEWMYADPGYDPGQHRRRLAPGRWPEVRESIGAYLLYAKRKYGVEPVLFSLNESNEGVMVLVTADEHRDQIKDLGQYFAKLGLKTKLLLGDVAGPATSLQFLEPARQDADARAYIGAVAFHSWHGAPPAIYRAWSETARNLRVPLLVTELGVESFYHTSWDKETYWYAMQELRMYQELLLNAQPQGTMEWEFTSDYALARPATDPARCLPTPRYWFVRHFANLTPCPADALATSSDRSDVLVTAFRGAQPVNSRLTIHIANIGTARPVTVRGLPAGASWKAVRTSRSESMQEVTVTVASNGDLTLESPAWSLVTLQSQ